LFGTAHSVPGKERVAMKINLQGHEVQIIEETRRAN
jgi:hypothetical protein